MCINDINLIMDIIQRLSAEPLSVLCPVDLSEILVKQSSSRKLAIWTLTNNNINTYLTLLPTLMQPEYRRLPWTKLLCKRELKSAADTFTAWYNASRTIVECELLEAYLDGTNGQAMNILRCALPEKYSEKIQAMHLVAKLKLDEIKATQETKPQQISFEVV